MGLEELIPDNATTSSSSSRRGSTQRNYIVEFNSPLGTKKFSEEKWKEIKDVISKDTEYTVEEVKNLQSEERHRVLHDVAQTATKKKKITELDVLSETRCTVCGDDCSTSYVEIHGEKTHIHHTIGQLVEELELELNGKANE